MKFAFAIIGVSVSIPGAVRSVKSGIDATLPIASVVLALQQTFIIFLNATFATSPAVAIVSATVVPWNQYSVLI